MDMEMEVFLGLVEYRLEEVDNVNSLKRVVWKVMEPVLLKKSVKA